MSDTPERLSAAEVERPQRHDYARIVTQSADERDERLRRIDAVTAAALSHLETDELLAELVVRVRALLGADTAAILLVDPDSRELVAAAADGLDEEAWRGLRLPLSTGFAGRVAKERRPILLNEADSSALVSQVLIEKGLATLLGMPMIAAGELVGVLHVGTIQPRDFSQQDLDFIQMVADRAALASQAGLVRSDRAATLALQRGLLPTHLPEVDGLNMAARYIPGHRAGVGGDWYDVFTLPSSRLGIVVGDVAGSGLRAAVVMGRLRSALRAYALESEDPADVLTRLDRKIQHFEAGNLATVSYAILEPATGQMEISLAGHLPPVLAVAGRPARLLTIKPDTPVGVGVARARRSVTVEVPLNAVCLFYTDGLVERRDEPIDVGLKRLCDVVHAGPAEDTCAHVLAGLNMSDARDDIALLAVSRNGR